MAQREGKKKLLGSREGKARSSAEAPAGKRQNPSLCAKMRGVLKVRPAFFILLQIQ
ncbi:MAG: hypothetical protein K2N30_01020 [Clostridia bacterium]|nr:hypothetical protein [Clostridia bacterium]